MQMQIVGIFDRKAQTFISMEPTPAIAVAVRQLTEAVNTNKDSPIHKWPGDFSLWHLGEWNSENGMVQMRTDQGAMYERKLIVECESLKATS